MSKESVTDEKIRSLLNSPKTVKNPSARFNEKSGHKQINYRVISEDGHEFNLFLRQSLNDHEHFSCGLAWNMPSNESLVLIRYNGPSHCHINKIEKNKLDFACHIHKASERYIQQGIKPDGYAEESNQYSTLDGALHQMVNDNNIKGLKTKADQADLFKNEH